LRVEHCPEVNNLEMSNWSFFGPVVDPFAHLWRKVRISGVALLNNERWISLSTRIALSPHQLEPDFFIQPTPEFIGFSIDAPIEKLDDFAETVKAKGSFTVQVANQDFVIFLTLAYADALPNAQPIHLGSPFSNINEEHQRSFDLGASNFRIANFNVENHYRVAPYEKLNEISSRLRIHTPSFNGVTDLIRHLGAPFDKHQNQTSFEVVAPLPFSMACSSDKVVIRGPSASVPQLRLIGFFDTGQGSVQLADICKADDLPKDIFACVTAEIPWPRMSTNGTLFLYMNNHEIGSVKISRWVGTPNWRVQVQEYFDPGRAILKKGLSARKEQTEFEQTVTRLLADLQLSATWYGDRQFQDRPDLAVCLELKNNWIVILGECTVQKPSVKFTPLLSRQQELEALFKQDITIIPVVFTSSTLSVTDKEQSRQDGIALVGADELVQLTNGVDQMWGPEEVIAYFKELLTAPLDFPIQWQS